MPSRRTFLKTFGAAGLTAPFFARGLRVAAPSRVLRHASFGGGGMAWNDVQALTNNPWVKLVAVANVDLSRIRELREAFPEVRVYQDWRQLLEKEERNIDSVNVSVPDHMHAPIALSAMQLGKHCYCQKPLAHDIHETRVLTKGHHWTLWADACLNGGKPGANFDYSGPLTESVLLGSVAVRFPQTTLKWNSTSLQFTNENSANRYVRRQYRDGWRSQVCNHQKPVLSSEVRPPTQRGDVSSGVDGRLAQSRRKKVEQLGDVHRHLPVRPRQRIGRHAVPHDTPRRREQRIGWRLRQQPANQAREQIAAAAAREHRSAKEIVVNAAVAACDARGRAFQHDRRARFLGEGAQFRLPRHP